MLRPATMKPAATPGRMACDIASPMRLIRRSIRNTPTGATPNAKKVKKVVTACPHCLHTNKNEYPQLGGNFEVRHHTQLNRELVAAGKIEMDATAKAAATGNGGPAASG